MNSTPTCTPENSINSILAALGRGLYSPHKKRLQRTTMRALRGTSWTRVVGQVGIHSSLSNKDTLSQHLTLLPPCSGFATERLERRQRSKRQNSLLRPAEPWNSHLTSYRFATNSTAFGRLH